MDFTTFTKVELVQKCKENGITKYSNKNKDHLIKLINTNLFPKNEPKNEPKNKVPQQAKESGKYTLIDLFCGTGAFSKAFHKTNKVTTIFANDMIDSSEVIFNLNRESESDIKLTKQNLIEIKDVDIPKSDIVTAGFPCQPFSIAGMQKGFEDERSNVFWKILSIVKNNNPKIVILQNVKNLQSHDEGKTFQTIIENLKKLEYHIKYAILNTSKITGIPQNRERIYIICFKDKTDYDNFEFDFPEVDLKPLSLFLEKKKGCS